MADDVRNVKFKLAVENHMREGFKEADKEMDGFFARAARKVKEENRQAKASGQSAIARSLGSAGGATSLLSDMLGVGIPTAIMGVVGQQLGAFSGKMVELRDAMRTPLGETYGGKSWQEVLDEGVGDVPILGGFWKAGRAIHELATGEQSNLTRDKQLEAWQEEMATSRNKFLEGTIRDRMTMTAEVDNAVNQARVDAAWKDPLHQAYLATDAKIRANVSAEAIAEFTNKNSVYNDPNYKDSLDKATKTMKTHEAELQVVGDTISNNGPAMQLTPDDAMDTITNPPPSYLSLKARQSELQRKIASDRDIISKINADAAAKVTSLDLLIKQKLKADNDDAELKMSQMFDNDMHARQLSLKANDDAILAQTNAFAVERLKLEGKSESARAEQIKASHEAARAVMEKSLDEDIRAHGGDTIYAWLRTAQTDKAELLDINKESQDREAAKLDSRKAATSALQSLLSAASDLPGAAYSADAKRLQYELSQQGFISQLNNQFADNPTVSAAIKAYSAAALSPTEIARSAYGPEGPLKLPSYNELPIGYTGMADAARDADLRRQIAEQNMDPTNKLLQKIADLIQTGIKNQSTDFLTGAN